MHHHDWEIDRRKLKWFNQWKVRMEILMMTLMLACVETFLMLAGCWLLTDWGVKTTDSMAAQDREHHRRRVVLNINKHDQWPCVPRCRHISLSFSHPSPTLPHPSPGMISKNLSTHNTKTLCLTLYWVWAWSNIYSSAHHKLSSRDEACQYLTNFNPHWLMFIMDGGWCESVTGGDMETWAAILTTTL